MASLIDNMILLMHELKERGEHSINLDRIEEGIIITQHGKATTNYWTMTQYGKLICIDTKTQPQYGFSIT
jgi:hypothetical protein